MADGVAPIPGTCGPFSMSFDTARGVHLIRTRNINAPYPGTPLPIDLFNELNSFNPDAQAAARVQLDRMRPLYPNVGNSRDDRINNVLAGGWRRSDGLM